MSPRESHQDRSRAASKIETNFVTYETLDTGVTCHFGWYTDGWIGTALDGTEVGKQVIFVNGSVVGVSYDLKVYKNYFVHKYTWGTVESYPHKQIIKQK